MYASMQTHPATETKWLRRCARASAAVVIVGWLMFFVAEVVSRRFEMNSGAFYQANALAFVFVGYMIGWRYELAGGLLTILGTILLFWVSVFTTDSIPSDAIGLFAVPGILYVLAWFSEKANDVSVPNRP